MKKSSLWSLRLGFSGKQTSKIEKLGLEKFLKQSSFAEKSGIALILDFRPDSYRDRFQIITEVEMLRFFICFTLTIFAFFKS